MKKFMITTALCSGVAFGAAAQTGMTDNQQAGASQGAVPAFLVSDLNGKTLYTLDTVDAEALRSQDGTAAQGNGMSAFDRASLQWTSSDTFLADRQNWQDIGQIGDVVMTQDGEVRGVILDVGGFLGFGAHTVMVETEDLYFVSDSEAPDDINDFFVVIAMTQEQLESLPEWNEDRLRAGFDFGPAQQQRDVMSPGADGAAGGMQQGQVAPDGTATGTQPGQVAPDGTATGTQQGQVAPDGTATGTQQGQVAPDGTATGTQQGQVAPDGTATGTQADTMGQDPGAGFGEGYAMLEGEERTVDRLLGADVLDANGENIGTVDDVVIDGEERISGLLVDVGGVLGLGAHTVNLPIDQAQIGWNQEDDLVRVRVSMTLNELEAMPAHEN